MRLDKWIVGALGILGIGVFVIAAEPAGGCRLLKKIPLGAAAAAVSISTTSRWTAGPPRVSVSWNGGCPSKRGHWAAIGKITGLKRNHGVARII